MWHLRTLVVGTVALALVAGSGCVVTRAKYNADIAKERQKTVESQKALKMMEVSKATVAEDLARKNSELVKKTGDLAAAQARTEALQARLKPLEEDLQKARTEVADKKSASRMEIQGLTAQLKSAQNKVAQLTQELEAMKKAAAPTPPPPAKE